MKKIRFLRTKEWLTAEFTFLFVFCDPAPMPGISTVNFVKAFREDIKKLIQ